MGYISKLVKVRKLVQDSLEENISRESFDKTLQLLIDTDSVKSKSVSNRVCLSITKNSTKVVADNRTFWKTVKPLLSGKVTKYSKINLVEDDKIISRGNQIAKKFSEYFTNILILNMPSNGYKCPDSSEQDPNLKVLDKYQNHPSIKLIKAKNNSQVFKFNQINVEQVKKSFQSLNPIKATQKTFSQNIHVTTSMIQSILQNFPTNRNKWASYLHIKKSKISKENYRPVSILQNVSKIYERCLYDQIATFFELIFSTYQCGFHKGYSTQHCLLALIEKWEKTLDTGGILEHY